MLKAAMFYKVSEKQYIEARKIEINDEYTDILIPRRATKGSAGYDFFAPFDFSLIPGEGITVPTGIRVKIDEGWALFIYPRSSLGFKYRLQLDNTVGVIDSDYFYSDNEGHIFIRITNDNKSDKILLVKKGDAFAQGVFMPYAITYDDNVNTVRNGGVGSTSGDSVLL